MSLNSKRITILKLERRIRSMEKRLLDLEEYARWSKAYRKALQEDMQKSVFPEEKPGWLTRMSWKLMDCISPKPNEQKQTKKEAK